MARLADLDVRVAALETQSAGARRPGARDAADAALIVLLAENFASHRFTAADAMTHARLASPALAAALEDTDVTSARELGHWLHRIEGVETSGFVLLGGPRDRRGGRRWRLRLAAALPT